LFFEQKRLSSGFRQCIREAISEIQFGGMAAHFAEVAIGLTRYAWRAMRACASLTGSIVICALRASRTNRPILDDQPGDAPKLSRVVGNQRQALAAGMSRDEHVVSPVPKFPLTL
jgi:hypothetical protein